MIGLLLLVPLPRCDVTSVISATLTNEISERAHVNKATTRPDKWRHASRSGERGQLIAL